MKHILFFVLISLLFAGCSTTKHRVEDYNTDNLIAWNKERPLSWKDFNTNAPSLDLPWSAVTVSFIAYRILNKHTTLVAAYFNKEQSWTVQSRADLLKHEQYHFNITEIFAREMRKKINERKLKPETEAFQILYKNELSECSTRQQEYDDITNHGKNKDEQIVQEKLIDAELAAMDDYKEPIIEN